jgi:hypothetical protein
MQSARASLQHGATRSAARCAAYAPLQPSGHEVGRGQIVVVHQQDVGGCRARVGQRQRKVLELRALNVVAQDSHVAHRLVSRESSRNADNNLVDLVNHRLHGCEQQVASPVPINVAWDETRNVNSRHLAVAGRAAVGNHWRRWCGLLCGRHLLPKRRCAAPGLRA